MRPSKVSSRSLLSAFFNGVCFNLSRRGIRSKLVCLTIGMKNTIIIHLAAFNGDIPIIKRQYQELRARIQGQLLRNKQHALVLVGWLGLGLEAALRATTSPRIRRRLVRALTSFAIILTLLIWPEPRVTLGSAAGAASDVAKSVASLSTVNSAVTEVRSMLNRLATSVVLIRTGPVVVPVPVQPLWSSKPRTLPRPS